jgi:hypothetical protein
MNLKENMYRFSGHQTFPFRYGWLEKGVRAVAGCATIFLEDDAPCQLGVGKNMVESIRHWCQLSQLIEPAPSAGSNSNRYLQPTQIARLLLLDKGWDPFLEDDASLWLVHWLIATNPSIVTSWQLLFSRFNRPDFTRREITDYLHAFAEKVGSRVSESVLARDVDCLIRTYVASIGGKKQAIVEETFDCPLLQLGLIQPSVDGELYRFAIGARPSLPAAVFAFALSDHFQRRQGHTETMSIKECLYGEASPGQVFKLDENSLIEYIEELEEQMQGTIMLDETAGLKQIYRKEAFNPLEVLSQYYKGDSKK